METAQANKLSEVVRQRVEEFTKLCEGVDEATASRAPSGRWSPKQIVAHLCGPEGIGFMPTVRVIVDEDTPRLDIEAENPFFTEKRAAMTFRELLAEFEREYGRITDFAQGLSEDQLSRKAHIPMLKETPLGEYPTLAQWILAIGDHHLGMHIDHMREILKALGEGKEARGGQDGLQ